MLTLFLWPALVGAAEGGTAAASTPASATAPATPASTAAAGPPEASSSTVLRVPADTYVLVHLSDAAEVGASSKKDSEVGALPPLLALFASWGWPVAAVLMLWMLLRSPPVQVLLSKLPRHVTQVSVAGVEIKLSEGAQATLDDLKKLIAQIPATHKDWVSNSRVRPQFQLLVSDIKTYLTTAACDSGSPLTLADFGSFRFTLHVPDVLLEHSLRQLVDYAGHDRGGAGRLFSMRIGIIGKAWRMERSEFVPNNTYSEDQLVEIWGMTREEARDTTQNRQVHLAVLIKSGQGLPLALLYGDSAGSRLFDASRYASATPAIGSPDRVFALFEQKVLSSSETRGLTQSLSLLEDQRRKVLQVDFYKADRR